MPKVVIYTDGACKGNPGPGGWAARLIEPVSGSHKDICGGEAHTTNNRMELLAVIRGLEALKHPAEVDLHCDSSYIINAFTQGWLQRWQSNGWRTQAKKPVENQDLWKELLQVSSTHTLRWVKVKGHAGVEHNEACDRLAVLAAQRFSKRDLQSP